MVELSWQYYIPSILTMVPIVFFYNRFLQPKYTSVMSTLSSLLFTLIWAYFITRFIYMNGAIKPFVSILVMYICVFMFYKDTIYKMLIAPIIAVAILIVSEIPFDFILVYIVDMDLQNIIQSSYSFWLQISVVALSFVIMMFVVKLFEEGKTIFQKYGVIMLTMSVQFLVAVTCISQIQFMEAIQASKVDRIQYILIMLVVSILSYGVMLYKLKQLYTRIKLEISMQKFKNLYEEQLKDYSEQDVNDNMIRYLRHDLTNYILSNQHEEH